jgi:fructokinase
MIAFLGEALVDLIGSKGGDGQLCFCAHPGGCALNAATAAARLDADVLYIGAISSDMFGAMIGRHFAENHVGTVGQLCEVGEHTMLAFANLDARGQASYSFHTAHTTIEACPAPMITHVFTQFDDIRYLHVGSVAVALDHSGDEIVRALEELDPLPFLFFDPNVRPAVIGDMDRYRKRVLSIARRASMIKLSDEDLRMLFPRISIAHGVDQLLSLGAEHVVLTKGKHGLQWRSREGLDVSVPAIDNPIVDTVGAGDTVSGALLCYLGEHGIGPGDPIEEDQASEALAFAAAAAAVTTSRKGADPPRRTDIVIH